MDGGLENMWLIDSGCSCLMIEVTIWFSNLTHLLSCVWLLWDLTCGFSVCLSCVGGHSFSRSMISHELFWDLMDSLTPFLVGWDEFMDMFLESLCWFMILFLWCFFWFFLCWSLERLSLFCSNDDTCSFLWAYISQLVSYGDSMASFVNQVLHLAHPHEKLSIFVLYPSLGFSSIYRPTLWDPRLGPISLISHAGWRFWEGEHEIWWSWSFAWSDWDTDGSPYPCSWRSTRCIVSSSLLYELSHTLSPYAYLKCEIALVLTWSHSMYDNCSILYNLIRLDLFITCGVHQSYLLLVRLDLFIACGVHRSYLLLVRLDLFVTLYHIALVTIHVVPSWCSSPV
jgi:hypothetical protein